MNISNSNWGSGGYLAHLAHFKCSWKSADEESDLHGNITETAKENPVFAIALLFPFVEPDMVATLPSSSFI